MPPESTGPSFQPAPHYSHHRSQLLILAVVFIIAIVVAAILFLNRVPPLSTGGPLPPSTYVSFVEDTNTNWYSTQFASLISVNGPADGGSPPMQIYAEAPAPTSGDRVVLAHTQAGDAVGVLHGNGSFDQIFATTTLTGLAVRKDGSTAYGVLDPRQQITSPKGQPPPVFLVGESKLRPPAWQVYVVDVQTKNSPKALGAGRPLAFANDGSLIVLTPGAVVSVNIATNTRHTIISLLPPVAGQMTSAAVSDSAMTIALKNPSTGNVDVYHFDPKTSWITNYDGSITATTTSPISAVSFAGDTLVVLMKGKASVFDVSSKPLSVGSYQLGN